MWSAASQQPLACTEKLAEPSVEQRENDFQITDEAVRVIVALLNPLLLIQIKFMPNKTQLKVILTRSILSACELPTRIFFLHLTFYGETNLVSKS